MAGLDLGFLDRVVNVQWGAGVYVIIAATNNDYATSTLESVKIVETKSEMLAEGEGLEPVSGTLIECQTNAGENFITLNPTSHNPVGLEDIRVYVCPKTDEVKDHWFEYVKQDPVDGNGLPTHPFLWIARTQSGSSNVMNFKIRRESHLISPPPDSDDKIAQAYPTSGDNTWPFGNDGVSYVITGWSVFAYRTDEEGTGTTYLGSGGQAAWRPDNIIEFTGGPVAIDPIKGLKFGTDPPKIASDESF